MKICYLAADFSGPGSYRCLDPGRYLAEKYGWECFAPEPEMGKTGAFIYHVGEAMPAADIYVLQQRAERVWLQLIPQLRTQGRIIVSETDDYYAGLPFSHPAYAATRDLVKPLHAIYAASDAMSVSTPFLKRAYTRINPNITVVPNYLDWELWEEAPERDWERVRIGWQGEARMRPDDMRVLQGIIGPFLERHREVDFVAAGDPNVHDILGVPEGQRVTYEKVLFWDVPKITATMDVGLVPLANSKFNEAKSWLKGMEYAACGIPCIATPSESYRYWVDEGVNGFLARRPKDWLRHLETFVTDHDLRKKMGVQAREKASRNTIQENVHHWRDFFESISGDWADKETRKALRRQALQKPSELAEFLRFLSERTYQTVVEIGTAQGGMLGALCHMAADDALIVSIDLPGGDLDDTLKAEAEDARYGKRDTSTMAGYRRPGQRIEFLQMDSHDVATRSWMERILDGRAVDLLFIDGDHTYEGVRQDWEMYRQYVGAGGLVGFHDILTHELHKLDYVPGVDRLWKEIKAEGHKVWEFVNTSKDEDRGWGQWGGIGVVQV